ncbi:MAG: ornithine cyclodeaminase family protein [Silvibacterium sp.]|nr:ornithine cyclodeaminase family protein [Silvibacterium sp.]
MLILDEGQVRRHLTYEALIPALEQALIRFSEGTIVQPVRSLLEIPENHGRFALMPVVDGDLLGVKLVAVFEENTTLPTHQAVIQLFSASTGEPLAVVDGRLITEMRTAAVTAIAARLFTPPRALKLAILGSGVQARSHLTALRLVREMSEVRVWSRTPENALAFARATGSTALPLEEAIRGADIVVGVANVSEPLILGRYLSEGAFVAAVAAVGVNRRELDDEAMQAIVVVESREAALRESGDIIGSDAAIYAEVGEILAGRIAPPPEGKRVVYKGLGIAAEDLAAARIVYEAESREQEAGNREQGVGNRR